VGGSIRRCLAFSTMARALCFRGVALYSRRSLRACASFLAASNDANASHDGRLFIARPSATTSVLSSQDLLAFIMRMLTARASCSWLIACFLPRQIFSFTRNAQRRLTSTSLLLDKRRFSERSSRQEERIHELQQLPQRTTSQDAELEGLQSKAFVEQYDSSSFSASHAQFKERHNHVFAQLCRYCGCNAASERNVFYLDGPDAGTTSALVSSGVPIECCHVANRHESTCNALREFGLSHVAHTSAQQALENGGDFYDVCFGAYYFDGCGGHPPIIIDMLNAALDDKRNLAAVDLPIGIGISIVGGNRDVVDKELNIAQALVRLAKMHGLRVEHVLDDCERYGNCMCGR
jgi:hypothetical protein